MRAQAKSVSFDADANAAYVTLSLRSVARTEEVEAGVLVDFDEEGHAVGVEILTVRSRAGANDPRSWAAGFAEGLLSRTPAAA